VGNLSPSHPPGSVLWLMWIIPIDHGPYITDHVTHVIIVYTLLMSTASEENSYYQTTAFRNDGLFHGEHSVTLCVCLNFLYHKFELISMRRVTFWRTMISNASELSRFATHTNMTPDMTHGHVWLTKCCGFRLKSVVWSSATQCTGTDKTTELLWR